MVMRRTLALLILLAGCGSAGAQIDATGAPAATEAPVMSVVEMTTVPPAPSTTVTAPVVLPELVPTTAAAPPVVESPEPETPAALAVPVVWPGPDARVHVLALPVTDVEKVVFGETIRVVAWYTDDGEALETFIFERADGSRALVFRNDLPQRPVWDISPDPCAFDFLAGGTHC